MLTELYRTMKFWNDADRIGPDMLATHWRLYFKSKMLKLCRNKFQYFDKSAEFRPGAYAITCSKIYIGKRVIIRPATMLFADDSDGGAGITIEDDVMMGAGVHIYVGNHRFDNPDLPIIDQGYSESRQVVLKKGCWIGANSIVLSGVTIGENAVVGAGTVVRKSVPDHALVVTHDPVVIE